MHHLEPDSPSRLAGKPLGGTGRACVDDDRRGTVGRVCPCVRPVGRSAVGVRGPPHPNLVGWTASSGSGEITLATALRDDRVPGRGSATAPGREAAPEKHRGQDPSRPPTIRLAPTVLLLGRCRSAVRAIGRQCRCSGKRLLAPGGYDRSPKQASRDDRASRRRDSRGQTQQGSGWSASALLPALFRGASLNVPSQPSLNGGSPVPHLPADLQTRRPGTLPMPAA